MEMMRDGIQSSWNRMSKGLSMPIHMAKCKLHTTKTLEGKLQESKAFVCLIHGFIPSI